MAAITSIVAQSGYLHIHFTGAYEQLKRVKEHAQIVLQASRDNDCTNLLLDISKTTGLRNISTMDEHDLAQFIRKMQTYPFRVAILFPEISITPGLLIGKHLENVAVNRGVDLRVFWQFEDALTWLTRSGAPEKETATSRPAIAAAVPIALDLEAGTYYWCQCGESKTQPFCDGSHTGGAFMPVTFAIEKPLQVYLCQCKRTATPPFCDGAHKEIAAE